MVGRESTQFEYHFLIIMEVEKGYDGVILLMITTKSIKDLKD